MTDIQILTKTTQNDKMPAEQAEIIRRLARLERLVDEFASAYLNAKFPYGKATDRWARARRGPA